MEIGSDIHNPQRMGTNDFGDPLTFHLAPPASQSSQLFVPLSQKLTSSLSFDPHFKHIASGIAATDKSTRRYNKELDTTTFIYVCLCRINSVITADMQAHS